MIAVAVLCWLLASAWTYEQLVARLAAEQPPDVVERTVCLAVSVMAPVVALWVYLSGGGE